MTKLMAFEFLLLKYLHERWTEKRSCNMQMKICEHWTMNSEQGKKNIYRTKQRPIFLINAIYKQYLSTDSPIWLNKLSFSFTADIFHWIHDIVIIKHGSMFSRTYFFSKWKHNEALFQSLALYEWVDFVYVRPKFISIKCNKTHCIS